MRILILGQHYAPEDVSGSVLVTELATDFANRGYKVYIVTGTPSYPSGIPYHGYKNKFIYREILNDVNVIRVWSYISSKKTFIRRLINYCSFSFMAFWGGLVTDKPDIILSFSPPLPLGLSAFLISRIRKVPWLLRVEDLFPDTAIQMGYFKNRYIQKLLYLLEKFLYKNADLIVVISDQFKKIVVSKGVSEEKVIIIPVWADPDKIMPSEKNNCIRTEMGFNDNFVVLYSGNIGLTSCIEDLISAAEYLRDEKEIQFLIIGEGVKKPEILEQIFAKKIDNITLLPYQPRNRYNEILALADINIVTLNRDASLFSLPGKTFNAMASGRPILSIAPKGSNLEQLISTNQIGIVVEPGHPHELADTIRMIKKSPGNFDDMAITGRELLINKFSKQICINLFENKMLEITEPNRTVD